MNTAWLDSSSTELTNDSTREDNEKQTRAAPPSSPTPPKDESAPEALNESPIARLVQSQERPTASPKPTSAAEQRPAPLPIGVLTIDPAFVDQLRSALDGAPTMSIAADIDEAAALAADGQCAILVTDIIVTRNALEALTQRLRAHDPAITIVVAGNRDHGSLFIGLQSLGIIDAFLLKPITTAATQLVIESATRRYRSACAGSVTVRKVRLRTQMRTNPSPDVATDLESDTTIETKANTDAPRAIAPVAPSSRGHARSERLRPSWPIVAIVAILVAGAVGWMVSQRESGIDPSAIVAKHLALAESALSAGRLLDARDGAAHHYHTVLAIDPQNLAAHRGLDAVARALSKETQAFMAQQRFADAAVSLSRLRELQPDYAELPLLDSQMKVLQDAVVASHASHEDAAPAPAPARLAIPAARERMASRSPAEAARVEPASMSRQEAGPQPQSQPQPQPQSRPPSESDLQPQLQARSEPRSPPQAPSQSGSQSPPESQSQSESQPHQPQSLPQAPSPSARAADALMASAQPVIMRPSPTLDAPAPKIEELPSAPASAPDLPQLVRYVAPRYPSDAHARQMEGWVEISMEIGPNGAVIAPRVEDGEKRQLFARAALAAVRQWKYAPDATRAPGKRSRVRVEFKIQ